MATHMKTPWPNVLMEYLKMNSGYLIKWMIFNRQQRKQAKV